MAFSEKVARRCRHAMREFPEIAEARTFLMALPTEPVRLHDQCDAVWSGNNSGRYSKCIVSK
jgi:hypothetical protein